MQPASFKSPSRRHVWLRMLSTRLHLDDGRFSDEDVLQTLQAVESGVRVGDLCAAQDISVETYDRWKVRYGGLTRAELIRRRRRDRWYQRVALGVLAFFVIGIGYGAFVYLGGLHGQQALAIVRGMPAKPRPASARPVSPATSTQTPQVPSQAPAAYPVAPPVTRRQPPAAASNGSFAQQPQASAPPPTPSATQKPPAPAPPVKVSPRAGPPAEVLPTDPAGYSVQVAAVPDLQEGRTLVEHLAAAGHFAYLTRTTVRGGQMYRVRVGPFQAKDQAEDEANRLKQEGYPAAWIAK